MPDRTVPDKLQVKPGRSLLLVNAPRDAADLLGPLPSGATRAESVPPTYSSSSPTTPRSSRRSCPGLRAQIKPGGMVWVAYHKGTSRVKTDINRDSIYAYALSVGLQGVAMISLDGDWSALRLKPV